MGGKSQTQPIKVTAILKDGRINSADGVIMLDSILYHAWYKIHAPHVLEGEYRSEEIGHVGLPLRRLPGNRYAASRAVFQEIGKTVEYYNKRPNFLQPERLDYLDMEKGLISESVGLYRAYRMPQVIRTVRDGRLEFWAVGNPEKVTRYLQEIPTIGKKGAMGYGIVRKWEVEPCDEDFSLWHPDYGLMRPVEVGSTEEKELDLSPYPILQYGIRPPYWKEVNFRCCYVPIVERVV